MGRGNNHNVPAHDADRPWGRDATNNKQQRIKQMDNYVDFYDFILAMADYDAMIEYVREQAIKDALVECDW